MKRRNKIVQEITRNVANVFSFYVIIAIEHGFSIEYCRLYRTAIVLIELCKCAESPGLSLSPYHYENTPI